MVMRYLSFLAKSVLATILAFSAQSVSAQEPSNCIWRSPQIETCLEDRANHSAAHYGISSLSDAAMQTGVEIRVFIIDGWNHERLAIIASRHPRSRPQIELRYGEWPESVATEAISGHLWDDITESAAHFDLTVNPPPDDGNSIRVCGDGLTYLIESHDAEGNITRAAAHNCDIRFGNPEMLAARFAERLQDIAAENLTHCADLRPNLIRGTLHYLQRCSMLAGDVPIAAEIEDRFRRAARTPQEELRRLLAQDVVLTQSDGTEVLGGRAVERYWRENLTAMLPIQVIGLGSDSGIALANIYFRENENGTGRITAEMQAARFYFERRLNPRMVLTRIELPEPVERP